MISRWGGACATGPRPLSRRSVEKAGRKISSATKPYTQALLRAIPEIDPDKFLPSEMLAGEPPSPLAIPPGCPFHPRCPMVMAACRADPVPALRMTGRQAVACRLFDEVIR